MSNDQKKAYVIERLYAGIFKDVAALYEIVYQQARPTEYFLKKYDTAYTGVQYIGYVAYNKDGAPIAYYGAIPTLLWCDGRMVLAAQSVDAMTHPKYQNSGIFAELAKLTLNLGRAEGIQVLFGFPNQNSFPSFINKLKWQVTDTMDRFTIPIKPVFPLEKLINRLPVFKHAAGKYRKAVLKKHIVTGQKGVANSVLDNHNGVFRDDNYLQYKSYSLTQVIRIDQSIIWIKLRNGLFIGDISGIADNFGAVMTKLCKLAGKLGMDKVHFYASPNTQLHALFSQHYQPITSFPVIFKDLGSGIHTENIKFTLADIDIF